MPPPSNATVLTAAQPKFGDHFDAWNGSSTGHQRAENRLGHSTEWRQSRNMKLSSQFKSGGTGGKRISDQVGAGSEDWDESVQALIPKAVKERAILSVCDMLVGKTNPAPKDNLTVQMNNEDSHNEEEKLVRRGRLFEGLVIYINGSTYPLISDHKLKHTLVENGAKLSLHLGRRQVTHIILGRPSLAQGYGAGGGLASTKIQKEIRRIGGCGVRYVGVEWVLESIKAGRRLQEGRFSSLKLASKGQKSVFDNFEKMKNPYPNPNPAPAAGT